MNYELKKCAIEMYGLWVDKYKAASNDESRFKIFQYMIGMREEFPRECGYWEKNYGPSF